MRELWRVKERSSTFDEFWWSLLWEKLYLSVVRKEWLGFISSLCQKTFCLYCTWRRRNGVYMEDIHWQWFKWFSLEITPPPGSWMSHFPKQKRRQQRHKRIESQCDICLACMLMFRLLICEFFRHKMTKFQQVQTMPRIILYNELFTHYITGK